MAKTLLLLRGVTPKIFFGLYYIKTGEFDIKIGKAIGIAKDFRKGNVFY